MGRKPAYRDDRTTEDGGGGLHPGENLLSGTGGGTARQIDDKLSILVSIVKYSGDAIFSKTTDGIITGWSPGAEKIYGYAAEEAIGMNISMLAPPDRLDEMSSIIEQIRQDKRVINMETIRKRKDGRLIDVLLIISPIVDVNGSVQGALTIARDITRRKQAEEASRKMSRVVEESPSTIVITDRNGNIEYANPTFTRLTGYTLDEVKGKNPRILKSGSMAPEEYKRLWDTILSGKEWRGEFLNKKKSGEQYWEYAVIAPLMDASGNITNFIAIKEDISERKRTEEALLRSRREIALILDNMPGFVYFKDTGGAVVMLNRKLAEAIGLPIDQIVGKTNYELFPEKAAEKFTRDDLKVLQTGEPLYTEDELPINGKVTLFATRKIPLKDPGGTVTGLIGLSFDITELKRAEEELAASKALADLYLDLMGHDIKNMNMIASTFLEMALDTLETTGQLDRSEAPLLEKPLESLQNSTNLISTVQKLQRSLSGEKKLEKMDVAKAIKSTIGDYSHVPGREVKIDFGGDCKCFVLADELLKDVFVNLIGNAIKHSSPDRPLTVNIFLRQAIHEEKRWCCTTIEDDGPGIPDNVKEQLFRRFLKGQTRAPRAGLGLYIVRALVDHYDGRISVEDRVRGDYTRGTRFIVELPAA